MSLMQPFQRLGRSTELYLRSGTQDSLLAGVLLLFQEALCGDSYSRISRWSLAGWLGFPSTMVAESWQLPDLLKPRPGTGSLTSILLGTQGWSPCRLQSREETA